MSCSGCRVLRKGCSDECILRPCLEWIESPEAQACATLFVSKFFGRSYLMSFVAAAPQSQRSVLFQSLLFDACGRTVNPVNGAVGLLTTGNWHICRAAVETVLAGGVITPISPPDVASWDAGGHRGVVKCMETGASEISEVSPESEESDKGPKLLNLFA